MNLLHIGIDIDSTLNRAHYYDILHGKYFISENHIIPPKEPDYHKCHVKEMFHFTEPQYRKYMEIYFPWNCKYNTPEIGAPENVRLLKRNHRISIVTARDDNYAGKYNGKQMKTDTLLWFKENQIPFDDIFFASHDKAKVCQEQGIDILIDDDPKNIIPCADSGIPVIIFGQSYNESLIGYPNTIWKDNWTDIRNTIENSFFNA